MPNRIFVVSGERINSAAAMSRKKGPSDPHRSNQRIGVFQIYLDEPSLTTFSSCVLSSDELDRARRVGNIPGPWATVSVDDILSRMEDLEVLEFTGVNSE